MKHKIVGSGETIIILRGLGRSFEFWLNFETELAQYFKVVMINLPGTDNEKEKTPFTLKGNVKKLAEKIKSLEREIGTAPYHVFGLSLGGLTALGLAYYYPNLVTTLTVASTSVSQFKRSRIKLIPLIKLLMMQIIPFYPRHPHRIIGKYLVSERFLKKHPKIINTWDNLWAKQKISKINFLRQLIFALFSLTPKMLKKIKTISLVLSGENDEFVPPANSKIINKALPNSSHIILPQIGHDVTTEDPATVAGMLRDFTRWRSHKDIRTTYQIIKEPLEFQRLKRLEKRFPDHLLLEPLGFIDQKNYKAPVYSFFISHKPDPALPTVAFFACFHGIEWIGSRVLINFIEHLLKTIDWDESVKELTSRINICGIPVINPVGRIEKTRTNGNGIDLMRNAPVVAEKPSFMLGGQKISPYLPWYMGEKMQQENKIAVSFLDRYVFPSNFKITMDIHSGFVKKPRIWTPYASGKELPIKEDTLFTKIKHDLNTLYKYNAYRYEKQNNVYQTHGDFWDYNFERHLRSCKGTYLPLTLEISSLRWFMRNFLLKWTFETLFNPGSRDESNAEYIKHLHLFNFILNFAKNYGSGIIL